MVIASGPSQQTVLPRTNPLEVMVSGSEIPEAVARQEVLDSFE